jgi:hypothetical protein
MEGENRLTPTDAYYIGIVDEVMGTKMTGRRTIVEQFEAEGKAKDAPSATSPTAP